MESTNLRVRVNVTCAGTLVALSESGAVIRLPKPQRPDQQTTIAIEDYASDTIYIPARVVRTEPCTPPAAARAEHHVFVEFLALSHRTAAAIRRLIGDADTVVHGLTA
ncbi:MAG: PilZ domain-containing protein [Acidobacteria bacterium]|nr:PilZ domain-containing protein [Acidobacteriota bacterium]